MMSHRDDINTILKQVEVWPSVDRTALAYEILRSTARHQVVPPPRNTAARATGLLRGDGPPPTDEQVEQWIEEERWRKYGR